MTCGTDNSFTLSATQWNSVHSDKKTVTRTRSNACPTNTWANIGVIFGYDAGTGATSITFFFDNVDLGSQTESDFRLLEQSDTTAILGALQQGDGSQLIRNEFFTGYVFCFYIAAENVGTSLISDDISTSCDLGCSICPETSEATDSCLWTCGTNKYAETGSYSTCQNCSCGAGSHINSWDGCRDSLDCNICSNDLCLQCDDFSDDSLCGDCKSNTEDPATQAGDCICDSITAFDSSQGICTCAPECATCTTLDRFHCPTCASGYYNQLTTSDVYLNICLDYCATVYYDTDGVAQQCIKSGDYLSTVELDKPNQSPPTGYPVGACDRGHYFTDNYITTSQLLHNETFINAWIRATDYSNKSTIYSRSKPNYTGTGTEDGINFYIAGQGGFLSLEVNHINISTLVAGSTNLDSQPDSIGTSWANAAFYMKYDSGDMTLQVLINDITKGTVTISNGFWEDSSSYLGYWGIQENTNTVASAAEKGDPFIGFMATVTVSSKLLFDTEYYFTSSCTGFGGCARCPLFGTDQLCQSPCDIDQYPMSDGSCGSCDSSCTDGCCHAGTANHCDSCYDYYCDNCTDYWSGDCTSCSGLGVISGGECVCTTNFLGGNYNRSDADKLNPCCAENCKTCTSEQHYAGCTACEDNTYKQPTSDANLFVCFANCPSGYLTNDSTDECDLDNTGPQVDFDLTTIIDVIPNEGSVNSILLAADHGLGSILKPFKMRGRYGAGDGGLKITGLTLHHSFTVSTWIYISTNSDFILFSKTKPIGSVNDENFLDLVYVSASTSLIARLWTGSTDHFGVTSSAATVSIQTWSQVGYVFSFDGTDTTLQMYVNGGSAVSETLASMYIDDQSTYVDGWLMMTRSLSGVESAMHGFMYRFTLANDANTSYITNERSTSSCSGTCASCAADRDTCFHDSNTLDVFLNSSNSDEACQGTCTTNSGCVRAEDCNLCYDRLCDSCFNFDDGAECYSCISDAGDNGLAPCACNDGFYFNDTTDMCETCHANCETCDQSEDDSYKFCPTCNVGFFKQRASSSAIQTCLAFCPTGETEDSVNKQCNGSDGIVFDLTLDSWDQNFLQVYDSIANIPFYLGYGGVDQGLYSESPYLVPETSGQCSKTFYFDGVDDNMNTISNGDVLVLGHSTSLSFWVKLDSVDTTGTLFTKLQDTADKEERFKVFVVGGSWRLGFAEIGGSFSYVGTPSINNDNWNLLTFVVTATGGHDSTLEIYGNGNVQQSTSITEQFSDDASNTYSYVGCTEEGASGAKSRGDFFKGYLYRMQVRNFAMTASDVTSQNTGNTFTCSQDCSYNEYLDSTSTCQSCTQACATDECVTTGDACSICYTALCTQCTSSGDAQCQACKTGASHTVVSSGTTGTCDCDSGLFYVDGSCTNCDANCATCTGLSVYECQSCTASGFLQPDDVDICLEVCPTGYTATTFTCTGSAASICYTFDTLNKQWTNNGVVLYAGSDSTDEALVEPWTYYKRGLYFNGGKYATWSRNSGEQLTLHVQFTISLWGWFTGDGTILSKSYNDFASTSDSDFLDIYKSGDDLVMDIQKQSGCELIFSDALASVDTVWQNIGLVVTYDKSTVTTSVTAYINNVSHGPSTSDAGCLILEEPDSYATLGARLDGDGASGTITNQLTGFIYTICITPQVLTGTQLDGYSTACDGSCSYTLCPSDGTCLWLCAIDQWYDGTSCSSCPSCGNLHVNAWDGCVDDWDCNVCNNRLCTRCEDFEANSVCTDCVTNGEIVSDDCECNSTSAHDTLNNICTCAPECEECTTLDKFHCSVCASGNYLVENTTFCLNYCPFNYEPHVSLPECVGLVSRQSLKLITQTLGGATAYHTCPMFYRGHYFPSGLAEPAYIQALDGILNSSGSIELWIKPDTL